MVDLGQITIEHAIVHEIPRHLAGKSEGGPILSEVQTDLSKDLRNFFRERISSSLGIAAYEVEFDPKTTSPMPELIRKDIASKGQLVADSHEMAKHLYLSQGGPSPEGLLTILRGKVGTQRALAILKLEKEEGARVRYETKQGKLSLSVDHVRDLMLTQKTKVFKVGLFVRREAAEEEMVGLVCDQQKSYGGTVALFFLERFLGCRLKEKAELTTKRFFETVQDFINEGVDNPETKAKYHVALAAELGGTKTTVSLQGFANANLDVVDRQPLVNRLTNAGFSTPSFKKDTKLIATHLRRIQFSFQSGVSVLTRPELIGEQVKVNELQDGRTKMEIKDHLKESKGRS